MPVSASVRRPDDGSVQCLTSVCSDTLWQEISRCRCPVPRALEETRWSFQNGEVNVAVRFFQEMNLIVSKHGRTAFRRLSRVFNAGNCSDSESMRSFWERGTEHKQQLSTCALVSALHTFALTVVLQAQCKQRLSPHKAMQMLSYRSSRLSPVERSHLARIPFCVSFSYGTDVNFKTI